jgi:hypothetical protein
VPFLYNKMPTNMNIQLSLKENIQNLKNEHTQQSTKPKEKKCMDAIDKK